MPKELTVYILTYNRLEYLKKTINCVLKQTYSDFDFYIVDNHSDDGTGEYIKSLNNPKIKYLCHEKNLGMGGNLKFVFENNKSEYFIMLHDDDIFEDNLIERELEYLKNNVSVSCVTCDSYVVDQNDRRLGTTVRSPKERLFSSDDYFRFFILERKSLCFPTTMYRDSHFKDKTKYYIVESGPCCDVVFYMNVERYGGTIAFIPEHLYSSRIHTNQITQTHYTSKYIELMNYLYHEEYYGQKLRDDKYIEKAYFNFNINYLFVELIKGHIDCNCVSESYDYIDKNIPSRHNNFIINKFLLTVYRKFPGQVTFLYKLYENKFKKIIKGGS